MHSTPERQLSLTLAAHAESRDNNFNLIRFAAASIVLFSHSFALTGQGELEPLKRLYGFSLGDAAVLIFFFVSGFLVCRSLLGSGSVRDFAMARALRIFPGLLVANLFAVFAIGASHTTLALPDYLRDPSTYRFLWRNTKLFFGSIQYKLPGVFTDLPYPDVVNGSLWSLRPEVKLYLWLALIGVCLKLLAGRMNQSRLIYLFGALTLLFVGDYLVDYWSSGIAETRETLQILFFTGATCAAASARIPLKGAIALPLLAILIGAGFFPGLIVFGLLLTMGYLILYLAYVPKGAVLGFNKFGDYSYGIYIYAFPVQQAIASSMPGISPLKMSLIAFPLVLLLAVISWYAVEKPMLAFKKRSSSAAAGGVPGSREFGGSVSP